MKTRFNNSYPPSSTAYRALNITHRNRGFSLRESWRELQLHLAATPAGRILLHLICLSVDGRIRWHVRGIHRELAPLLTVEHRPAAQTAL